MVNITLLWYLLVPLFLSGLTIVLVRRWMPSVEIGQILGMTAGGFAISALIMTSAFYMGKGSRTSDIEILNGEVTGKARVHGSYIRTYPCNCRQVCSGSGQTQSCSTVCDTCYENRYTVDWKCSTNIGGYTIKAEDWGSSGVYKLPDPPRWTLIKPGDPVSGSHSYTNYIKAVPETLFRPASAALKEKYKGQLPAYPGRVYDFYHVDRVVAVGVKVPDIRAWNDKLSEGLKKLGPQRQANAVVVLTKFDSDDYFFALQDEWRNGKKNDIVVVVGAPDYPAKAAWVRVMALTTDEIFQVRLRDRIQALDTITADGVVGAIRDEGFASFKRKSMKDFKYLDAEIDPPGWVMNLMAALITIAYAGFLIYIYRYREGGVNRYGMPSRRRQ